MSDLGLVPLLIDSLSRPDEWDEPDTGANHVIHLSSGVRVCLAGGIERVRIIEPSPVSFGFWERFQVWAAVKKMRRAKVEKALSAGADECNEA